MDNCAPLLLNVKSMIIMVYHFCDTCRQLNQSTPQPRKPPLPLATLTRTDMPTFQLVSNRTLYALFNVATDVVNLVASQAYRVTLQPIPVTEFSNHVDKMHADSDYGFSEEYAVCVGRDDKSCINH